MEELTEKGALSAIIKVEQEAMITWSDGRRTEFVKTFEDRARVTRYLLHKTAELIWERATSRRYVSNKHKPEVNCFKQSSYIHDKDCGYPDYTVGGRLVSELITIAEQRAETVLDELPPIKKAVLIIDPATAKKMDKRDELLKKVRALKHQLEEIGGPISMAEVNQDMTVGEFRKMVKDRDKKRTRLLEEMEEIAVEGNELDQVINKKLYEGFPGLSNAVIKVVNDYDERAIALDATTRRVNERVMFGDSKTAMELLKNFEKDEVEVSDRIKLEFKGALEKLKIAGKRLKAKNK